MMTNVYQITPAGAVIPREVTGTIKRVERMGHTVYGIENPEYRDTTHTFVLTRAGRISHTRHA